MGFDPKKLLSETKAKFLILDHLDHGGTLTLTRHARDRMEERRYSFRDLTHIIKEGSLAKTEYNETAVNWKYTFRGEDLDGTTGAVVVAIACVNDIIIVSVLSS